VEWLIDLSGEPQVVEQDCQLASHSHNSPFLRVISSPFGHLEPPATEFCLRAERAQDMVGRSHKQSPEELVACLADVQLWG
jgi:hypothetical protein